MVVNNEELRRKGFEKPPAPPKDAVWFGTGLGMLGSDLKVERPRSPPETSDKVFC
jgi:hypothetical protein